MSIRHLLLAVIVLSITNCATTQSNDTQPNTSEHENNQVLDPIVDPEVMSDRPIESTTLEPDQPSKPAKNKKKAHSKKKK